MIVAPLIREERAGPVVWTGIIAVTCLLLVLLEHMLWLVLPFIFGTVMYYTLLGPMRRLLRLGFSRSVSSMLVCAVFFGLSIVRSTMALLEAKFPILAEMHLSSLANKRFKVFTDTFAQRYLATILVTAAGWLPSLLLAPFLAFFFLRDGLRFKKFLARAVPNAYFERTLFLLHQVDQTARRYFEGLLKLTVLDTIVLGFGLWVIGVSSPLLLGFISALLAWVPFIGSVVGCVMVVIVAATDAPSNPLVAYGAIVVFILARLLDDFVFMPITLGRSLKIHPLITVLMIFIGGALSGVAGLMLVLPLLGVVMVIGETLGRLMTNPRLLRVKQASGDLRI
jgi:predicted PurR-regulated permease PerM